MPSIRPTVSSAAHRVLALGKPTIAGGLIWSPVFFVVFPMPMMSVRNWL